MPVVRAPLQIIWLSALVALFAGEAAAYGPTAHRIVGMIAESYLCQSARVSIEEILDGESLAEAGLWADRIRGDPAWRHASPWHYINVADDAAVATAEGGGERGDVLRAIARFRAESGDAAAAPARRAEALRFLVHFVADVHQPLHVGRAEDRGGNRIDVVVEGKRTNLHALWDAELLLRRDRRARGYTVADQARTLRALTAQDVGALQRAEALDWARESKAVRPYVYGFARSGAGPVAPDDAYLATAAEISMLRLSQSAVRLAGVLNELFCSPRELP